MFTKNAFVQKDPIAEAIAKITEADYKAKMEELKGQQHKIDKNKNGKIDAHDFKILRGEKKTVKEEEQVEEGWDDMLKAAKERSKPQPSGGSGVKLGTRYGGGKQKEKPEHDDKDDKKEMKEGWDDMLKAAKERSGPQPSGGSGIKQGSRYGGSKQKEKPEHDDKDDKKMEKEEVEQVDELSKKTLGSYIKHASNDRAWRSSMAGAALQKGDDKSSEFNHGKSLKRAFGIYKAADRLAKEEVEQVDERTLTPGETKEKERIVKGMKKSLKGFKARYGERAKEVMYATATKAAKKD